MIITDKVTTHLQLKTFLSEIYKWCQFKTTKQIRFNTTKYKMVQNMKAF